MTLPRRFLVFCVVVLASISLAGCSSLSAAQLIFAEPTTQPSTASSAAESVQVATSASPASLQSLPETRNASLKDLDVSNAPDGLGDLVSLRRAEAALDRGDQMAAKAELHRPEMQGSTNRLILEQAGKLAERVGDLSLAGNLYARGAGYFGWSAERIRMYVAAGSAYRRAGLASEAAEQYRTVVESYTFTKAAEQAGDELASMGALTAFHHGILEISNGDRDVARKALAEAAKGGPYASAAASRLRSLEESVAWLRADDDGSAEAYRSYRADFPNGAHVVESRFQEGLALYSVHTVSTVAQAVALWDDAAAKTTGDERARALIWASKALDRLGKSSESQARLKAASEVHPAGYYTVRARDLLAGKTEWTKTTSLPKSSSAEEEAKIAAWIEEWAKPSQPDTSADLRVRRGLGLAALGLNAEAEAELNGVIAASQDPRFLFKLAIDLTHREMWTPASRAAGKVAGLSPAVTYADAPLGLQRLIYPVAYPSLIAKESDRRGLDPLLLLSLLHQESRYDAYAISYADARGIAQVMPSTGKGIAPSLGIRDFTAEDLYKPEVGIQFGAFYLSDQMKSFGGDPFKSIAAYNAGGGPVPRWSSPDPDAFVERINYSQTRDYVRQIYVHYAIYRSLAETP